MNIRDRSNEFAMIAQQAKARMSTSGVVSTSSSFSGGGAARMRSRNISSSRSQFNALASEIGAGVHQVANELASLTKLVKEDTSIFNEDPRTIDELMEKIKMDIDGLNRQLQELNSLNPNDGGANREHAEKVVGTLNNNLMRTTADFKNVLKMQIENTKNKQSRRSEYSSRSDFASRRADPSFYQTNLPRRRASPTPRPETNDVVVEIGEISENQALLTQEQYSDSRAEAMNNINKIIHDLSGIFTQLATMVSQQQEQIERIDSNVEDSLQNVEEGHAQLLKYMKNISTNRPLIIKTFIAILITMIMFIILS